MAHLKFDNMAIKKFLICLKELLKALTNLYIYSVFFSCYL